MKNKEENEKHPDKQGYRSDLKGYPLYPSGDDIYHKSKEEKDLDPEDISKTKSLNENDGKLNEKDFAEDISGRDLDVPGSEADNDDKHVGNEDEENNHYSLGGDAHTDLDEDKR